MKRYNMVVFALVLAVLLCACGNPGHMNEDKLHGKIISMVEDREQIPEDYLDCLDGELEQVASAYNDATKQLRAHYTDYGMGIYAAAYDLRYQLFDVKYEPKRDRIFYSNIAWNYETFSGHLAQACLYPDAPRRVRKDWYLSVFANFDSGGSYGLWASCMHEDFYVGYETAEAVQEYFRLIDDLTGKLQR